jgi:carbamoyl-phosphate synthase large subunit
MVEAVQVSNDSPVLLDRFLDDAIEVDVDAICDGGTTIIGGIMEHIEEAGVHSGDSACSLPPYSLTREIEERIRLQVRQMAAELKVVGLMNTQFAIQGDEIFVLEVNPRASRTVPFVSKATGLPLAKIAARCMVGKTLAEQGVIGERVPAYFSVKESVFPFIKFPGVDPLLGPEMKSTGEVMGVGRSFAHAFNKAEMAGGMALPREGAAFISVRRQDRPKAVEIARCLIRCGFEVYATRGTGQAIQDAGLACAIVNKVTEGRPHIVDMIKNDLIDLIVNTTEGKQAIKDSYTIRREALNRKVTYTTTVAGAKAICLALQHDSPWEVNSLQELHREWLA